MENQHRKIKGYRELSQTEIDLMNKIKTLGLELETVVKQVEIHIDTQCIPENSDDFERLSKAQPRKWLSEGTTTLQTGLMQLTRAIAQPTFF